jgi:23S rRNA (adenine-N6)-dimethyltransferase
MYSQNKEPQGYNIKYSQNFFKSPHLSKQVIELADLSKNDFVIEIGPGKGALTQFIAKKCRKVVAVEKDRKLFQKLQDKFSDLGNMEFVNSDFLNFKIPKIEPYKVIGNIPFGFTTEILKRLLDCKHAPIETYLILQKEAALRFLGLSANGYKETLFSLRFKPFYKGKIIKTFQREDFSPKTSVDVVMLHISKRDPPLIKEEDKSLYLDFLAHCFITCKKTLKSSLQGLFTDKQLMIIKNKYSININSTPTEITFEDWLTLFNIFIDHVPESKKRKVIGAFYNLKLQQKKLVKWRRTKTKRFD